MNSFQLQVLDFTYGFPPVYGLTKNLIGFNYRKHFHNFMNGVENVVMFLIAVGIVLRQKWIENDCNERVQLAAMTSYQWMKETGIPKVQNAIQATYNAGVKVREFYNLISSPLFITL